MIEYSSSMLSPKEAIGRRKPLCPLSSFPAPETSLLTGCEFPKEIACGVCHNVLHSTMIIKSCLCRFCSTCIVPLVAAGCVECPQCAARLPLRQPVVRDANYDAVVSMLVSQSSSHPAQPEYTQDSDEEYDCMARGGAGREESDDELHSPTPIAHLHHYANDSSDDDDLFAMTAYAECVVPGKYESRAHREIQRNLERHAERRSNTRNERSNKYGCKRKHDEDSTDDETRYLIAQEQCENRRLMKRWTELKEMHPGTAMVAVNGESSSSINKPLNINNKRLRDDGGREENERDEKTYNGDVDSDEEDDDDVKDDDSDEDVYFNEPAPAPSSLDRSPRKSPLLRRAAARFKFDMTNELHLAYLDHLRPPPDDKPRKYRYVPGKEKNVDAMTDWREAMLYRPVYRDDASRLPVMWDGVHQWDVPPPPANWPETYNRIRRAALCRSPKKEVKAEPEKHPATVEKVLKEEVEEEQCCEELGDDGGIIELPPSGRRISTRVRTWMEESSSQGRPLVLWPDMRSSDRAIPNKALFQKYLYVDDRTTVGVICEYVKRKLCEEFRRPHLKNQVRVELLPVTMECPASDIVLLDVSAAHRSLEKHNNPTPATSPPKSNSRTAIVQPMVGGEPAGPSTQMREHAFTIEPRCRDSDVITTPFPHTPLLEHMTMAEVRFTYPTDPTRPFRIIYSVVDVEEPARKSSKSASPKKSSKKSVG